MYNLVFSNIFYADVSSSHNYIKDKLEAPKAAEELKIEILEKIEYIKLNPLVRPLVQDKYLASLGLRSIKVKKYLLFYLIRKDKEKEFIFIARFMYSKRDWAAIILNESINEIV